MGASSDGPTTDGPTGIANPAGRPVAHFFEMAVDLLAAIRRDGIIVRASAAWSGTTGWANEELVGTALTALLHPADLAEATAALAAVSPTQPTSFTARFRARGGHYLIMVWNATVHPPEGDLVHCLARDVTEPHRREQRHRALNAAWLAVASEDSVTDVLGVVNQQARALIGARQAVTSITVGDAWEQAITAVSLADEYSSWRTYDGQSDGTGIYAEVLRSKKPMRATQDELERHPLWRAFGAAAAEHPPMRGWLAVPLVGRAAQSLGLIQLSDKDDGSEFDEEDEQALVEFARIAALTVERAQAELSATDALGQLQEMLDSISDAFIAFDTDWHITFLNPAARLLVQDDVDPTQCLIWDVIPDTPDHRFRREYLRATAESRQVSFRAFYERLAIWFDVRVFPFRSGLAVYFVDVTDREAATDDLERRVAMQAVVAELGQAALTGLDVATLLDETVVRLAEVLRVTGVGVLQLVDSGRTLLTRSGTMRETLDVQPLLITTTAASFPIAALEGSAIRQSLDQFDWAIVDHGDNAPPVVQSYGVRSGLATPIGRRGAPWGVLAASHDETGQFGVREGVFLAQMAHILSSAIERQENERAVLHQATHDALTGLPNRQLLRDRMDAALARLNEQGTGATLLLLDLDGFKDVNDSLGHATGDIVLQQVSDRLSTLMNAGNTVARLGGDEFAVLVEDVSTNEAAGALAERIVSEIAIPFSLPELDVPLSASVGVVLAPAHGTDASTLLRRADVAMYRAKAQALGWALYDNDLDAARADRLTTIAELRRGILDNELELHYQPIIHLETGAVSSIEALVRWQHPTNGLVPPLSFIPLAEQTGLIVPLTAWVVEEALRQSALWHASGFTARIAVNLSVDVLTREVATDPLLTRLMSAPDRLTAEITESSLADERARNAVTRLATAGVACAVDDFGTGYSSLAYLKNLPVTQLKIDREFVMDVTRTQRDRAIVRSVADLGTALGLDVVAEGVEDGESVAALRSCGVHLAQGYFFARPMTAAALDEWLARRDSIVE